MAHLLKTKVTRAGAIKQTFATKRRASKRYFLASIAMLVLVFVVDRLVLSEAEFMEATQYKVESKQSNKEALKTPQINEAVNIVLTDIRLPPPPSSAQKTLEIDIQHTVSGEQKRHRQKQTPAPSEQQAVSSSQSTQPKALQVNDNNENASFHSQRVLDSLQNISMQIHMPRSISERERVIQYLYQCVGIGLAAINWQEKEKRMMPLSTLPSERSHLLRSVSGQLAKHEHRLHQAYAPKHGVVRVYPMSFDQNLSRHIAGHLNSQALTSFQASYALSNGRLSLENITINDLAVKASWPIFNSNKRACRL